MESMEIDILGSPSSLRQEQESPMADNEISSSGDESDVTEGGRVGRSRKSTDRFLSASPPSKAKKSIEIGTGTKLGEISKIADKLAKVPVKDDALKRLHRVLFGSDGTATTRKKEIRLWNGTTSAATKTAMTNGIAGAKSVAMLKDICSILSLATGGDRASLESRIVDFLVKPSGSTAPLKPKKSSSKKTSSTKTKRSSSDKPKRSSSAFANFLKTRMDEVMARAAGSLSARDVTELLTMEWKHMSESEKAGFGPSEKPKLSVHKVIAKNTSPRRAESSEENHESSSDSSSDSSSSSSSSDSEGSS
jgi:hypothetical protein